MRWGRKMVNVTGGLDLGLRGNLSATVRCFGCFWVIILCMSIIW